MWGLIMIGAAAIGAIAFMRYRDVLETSILKDIFKFIEENNGITKDSLLNNLNNWEVDKCDKGFCSRSDFYFELNPEKEFYYRVRSMGHTTGEPVIFLNVFYDKNWNYVKTRIDIGMSNTITKTHIALNIDSD